jgi:putative ABC transport system ATP-binding protein
MNQVMPPRSRGTSRDDAGPAILRLRDVHKSYTVGANTLHVLKGIDLDIGAGELVSIMGASGSGKSTLLNVLGLLDGYDEGEYLLDGQLVRGLSETKAAVLRGALIGFVFQSFNLIAFKTAAENVALPLYYQGVPRRVRNQLAEEMLEKVGLRAWAAHLPRELSGGQQQRVAIARAKEERPSVPDLGAEGLWLHVSGVGLTPLEGGRSVRPGSQWRATRSRRYPVTGTPPP